LNEILFRAGFFRAAALVEYAKINNMHPYMLMPTLYCSECNNKIPFKNMKVKFYKCDYCSSKKWYGIKKSAGFIYWFDYLIEEVDEYTDRHWL